ncbi:protein ITPRID1 isoform X1 [Anolis sagrei]|uniref:protein ITPRID1 isoform X1 n=1 Tax=Anolis sagrei TaxID=38937 RepID=UPI003522A6CD
MNSEYRYHGSHNIEKKKRERLLSTRKSWVQQDEDFSIAEVTLGKPPSTPHLVDRKEANLCSWMDSGFYLSTRKDSQESRDKAAALSPPLGMVQMTVQNYMRSLHRFSEMPALSRWNSANPSHSLPSTPKSIIEWLDFSEKDPVEVLLDLGFGTDEPDICTKIPSRFISCASAAKGINIRVFIEAQRQRMDLENPNLCGRFRQLEVLDHVTSAFSSLLHDVSAMQQKPEDEKRDRTAVDSLKEKPVVTQTKRRRIGQLLRKASRQTTVHGPQAYRSAGQCKAKEDYCPAADMDLNIMTKASLSDSTALVCLKEELFPSEEAEAAMTIAQLAQSRASKTWALPHPAIKQPRLPSCYEMALKDRPHKESNLLLTHMLRRVSGFGGKPAESFEMEEIQSFEDESSWGNPLESTSDMIVTRTNSCQSDSSGFLEDPSEPLPLQALSLPGNLRLSFSSHDGQSFLWYRKDSISTSQDLQSYAEGPNVNTTAGSSYVALLPNLSREHTFQGEEIFYSISEEDDLCVSSACQEESAISENGHQLDEMEIRREFEKGDVQESFVCHHSDNMNQVEIRSPEENCLSHGREENPSIFIDGGQVEDIRREDDGVLTEETEIKEISKGDVCLEGVAEGVAEKLNELKVCGKLDSPLPLTDLTSGCQDADLSDQMITLVTANTFKINNDINTAQSEVHVISRTLLPGDSFLPSCSGKEETGSLDKLPRSMELDQEGYVPCFETNSNSPLKSVTVQMPSRLLSNMQSISLGETSVKSHSIDFTSKMSQCSKDDPLLTPVSVASNTEDKQIKEVSIQTDKNTRKKETLSQIHCLPSFHRHGHLVKSTSLDTGLHRKHRSCCHEPSRGWCIQPRGHCCSLNSHHCCSMWPFSFVTSCNHPAACCSSYTTTELQLLKTLKLLQDTALRNISSSTVQEIEVMKNSCQKFRERLDEIEQHMLEQEAIFSTLMPKEGREERSRLQVLRQAVRREVAELEAQLQDRMHQVREGILTNLDQLLGEQSNLCSELGIPGWREEKASKNGHTPPDSDAATSSRAKYSKKNCPKWTSSRSATVPSTASTSSFRQDELQASAFIAGKPSSASDSEELHASKKEPKAPSQTKLDFKAFIQNLKRSFRNSFNHDAAGGKV